MRLYPDKFVHGGYKIQHTSKYNVTILGLIAHHKILSELFCVVGGWGMGVFSFSWSCISLFQNTPIVICYSSSRAIVQKREIIQTRQF